jgi:hypothetical protein
VEIKKIDVLWPVSQEVLDDAADVKAAYRQWMNATPGERQAMLQASKDRRRAERQGATPAVLTMGRILDRFNVSRAFAQHLVQPYCTCEFNDGWELCSHAYDLGLRP